MIKLTDCYDLWKVYYMTYNELQIHGELRPTLVERNMTYAQGLEKLKFLPLNYCIKPSI